MSESRDFSYESKDKSAKHKNLPVFSFPPMSRRNSKTAVHTCVGGSIDSVQHSEFLLEKSLSDIDSHVDSHAHQTADVQSHKASNNGNANNACKADDACKHVGESVEHSDINSLLNCLTSVPHFKDQRFSTRRDVVNKSILRIMKRYYVTLFKSVAKGKQRLNTVNEHLEASLELLGSLKGYISVNSHLKYHITQMVSTKLTSKFEVASDVADSLKLLNTCLYSYSDKALKKIFEDASARLLFNYFYRNGQEFFMQQNNVNKNLSEYLAGLESFYNSFNGPNAK